MSFVDDVKEQVCGIRAVREIADLVDDQDGWMRVDLQRLRELSLAKRGREIVSESGGGGEEDIEAVAVGNGDRQVRFPSAPVAGEDQVRPSVTKSGANADPSIWSRSVD